MKKISLLPLLAILTMPALAEEVETSVVSDDAVVEQTESATIENVAKQFEQKTPSNPKIRFPHGLQLGVGVSPTSGLNGFVGYNNKNFDSFWWKRFGVRFDFATYSPIKSKLNKRINDYIGDEGIEIDDNLNIEHITLDAKHYGVIVDFYPFGDTWFLGGLRLSGGYFSGKLNLNADVCGTDNDGKIEFDLNDHKYYYIDDEMHAKAMVNWKYSGPYLGTGFDLGIFCGLKMYFDAGVVFTDNTAKFDMIVPTDNLKNGNGEDVIPGTSAYNQFNSDKTKEIEDARDEIKDYTYYPIVKFGIMYRF